MPKQATERAIDTPFSKRSSGSGTIVSASGTATSIPVHGLESIYHTGNLDSRYYTEAELDAGQLNSMYYTEAELNAGQLDTRYYTETESDAKYALLTTTITGTGALGGGGAISANRTVTLNTPGALSATSANSSSTNHTHSIDSTIARSAITVTGTGALGGGGDLTTNRTVTLNTPGSLTATSTNSSTTNHTHAITASADVGTTPAESLLKSTSSGGLTLATLTSKGNVNVTSGGDLTVGANIFFVDASGTNVGINCAPDAQFDLDVAGNLRAQGWIVGKHAVQLKDAVAIFHYDGATEAVEGEPNDHMGHVPTAWANSPVFVRGKFGKALSLSPAATTLISNNSFESNVTGWTNTNCSLTQVAYEPYHGRYCAKMTTTVSAGNTRTTTSSNTVVSSSYTFSVALRGESSSTAARIALQNNGGTVNYAISSITITNEWQVFTITGTATEANAARCVVIVDAVATVYADAAQCYAWGSALGFSPSTRAGDAYASYSTTNGMRADRGTVMAWVRPTVVTGSDIYIMDCQTSSTNRILLYLDSATSKLRAVVAGGTQYANAAAVANTWYHVALTWENGTGKLYVNGVQQGANFSFTAFNTLHSTYTIGSASSGTWRGDIDEFVIVSRALPAAEILTIYQSDAPVFAETSVFHFRSGNGLVWGDAEGLWMYDTAGLAVLGASGVDGKSWGGSTLDTGDIQFGQYGSSNGGWLRFDRNGASSKPLITLGYSTSTVAEFDSGGSRISGVLDVTGTVRTKVSGTVYTTLNSSGLTLTEQTDTVGFGYHAAAAFHQGYLTMYSGAYDGYLPSSIARRTLIEQEYSGGLGEYTQIVLQTHAPDFSSNVNKSTLTIQSSPDGANFFEFRSAATSLSYKAYIKFESMKFSTAALGAYYGKILCRVDGSSTDRAIPIYTW